MKCENCGSALCRYRDVERNCFYESHPDYTLPKDFGRDFRNNIDWHSLRNQAAIAAMQGFLSRQTYKADLTTLAKDSVRLASCLIEELKKK